MKELPQRSGVEIEVLAATPALGPDEAARLEHLQVLGNGLACQGEAVIHGERCAELEQGLSVPRGQGIQNGAASRRSQRIVDVTHAAIIGK